MIRSLVLLSFLAPYFASGSVSQDQRQQAVNALRQKLPNNEYVGSTSQGERCLVNVSDGRKRVSVEVRIDERRCVDELTNTIVPGCTASFTFDAADDYFYKLKDFRSTSREILVRSKQSYSMSIGSNTMSVQVALTSNGSPAAVRVRDGEGAFGGAKTTLSCQLR